MEYIIVGDTENYDDCLVCLAGGTIENAEKVLDRVVNHPTKDDEILKRGHRNLRIKAVENKSAWWNDPFMCN